MNRSWKTTLIGWAIGLPTVGISLLQGMAQGQHIDWKQVGFGLGIGLLGTVAKDFNVTGAPEKRSKTPKPQLP